VIRRDFDAGMSERKPPCRRPHHHQGPQLRRPTRKEEDPP
jgi:hypothetical protein